MALKKMRPPRSGTVPELGESAVADNDSAEQQEEEEEAGLEVQHKKLHAQRWQGIVKTLLVGIDEMSVYTFISSKDPELVVAIIDSASTNGKVTITVKAHPWATELAVGFWDEIDLDGLDPNTCDPNEDGWIAEYKIKYS